VGCKALTTNVEHTLLPPSEPPTGLSVLFGSVEQEQYTVREVPFSASNAYPVNEWFREKLTQWSATAPLAATAKTTVSATLRITVRDINTDLDVLGEDGGGFGGVAFGAATYPTYASIHKTVHIHLTASLERPGTPPCVQKFTGRATEQRALWIPRHPFHSAYDFEPTFHRAIDDAIGQLDEWSCGE
jgi:hypothetical protein